MKLVEVTPETDEDVEDNIIIPQPIKIKENIKKAAIIKKEIVEPETIPEPELEPEPEIETDVKLEKEEKIFYDILLDYEEIDENLLVLISQEQGLPKTQPRGIMASLIRKINKFEADLIEITQSDDGNIFYTVTDMDAAKEIRV